MKQNPDEWPSPARPRGDPIRILSNSPLRAILQALASEPHRALTLAAAEKKLMEKGFKMATFRPDKFFKRSKAGRAIFGTLVTFKEGVLTLHPPD